MARLGCWYQKLAVILLNTLLFLTALGLGVYLLAEVIWGPPRPGSLGYGDAQLALAYPGWDRAERDGMLTEIYTRPLTCDRDIPYREAPYSGTYVHVADAGFRWLERSAPPPWPPPADHFVVFMLGGSTTFGYGLPDEQTIPAHVQQIINQLAPAESVQVYNFGQAYYASPQEFWLLQSLLRAGHVPDLVIFLDGLNELEYEGVPATTALLACDDDPLDLGNWAAVARYRTSIQRFRPESGDPVPLDGADLVTHVPDLLDRWQRTRTMIRAVVAAYGIHTVFVWQPVADYGYDLQHDVFLDAPKYKIAYGYELMAQRRAEWSEWDDFLYLADIQTNRTELLYVDRVHYTQAFSAELAQIIVDYLIEQNMVLIGDQSGS